MTMDGDKLPVVDAVRVSDDATASDGSENGGGSLGDVSKSPYDYAVSYFFGFLATTSLCGLVQCAGVQFVGLPRVGKSSAVSVQCGSTASKRDTDDDTESYEVHHRKGDPKVSHSTIAKTVNISVFRDFRLERYIIDTPGLNDNRSEAFRLWSNFSLETAYALTESIDATCVVIHYLSSFAAGADARNFRKLAVSLLASSGDGDQAKVFMDNLCFMFTHVGGATVPGIIRRLTEVHASYLSEQINILQGLQRRFPNHSSSSHVQVQAMSAARRLRDMAATALSANPEVQKLQNKVDKLRGRIDFENHELQSDPEMTNMEQTNASILLLEAIIASPRRIVLSRPDGFVRCREQRWNLERAFRACRPLGREQLRDLAGCRRLPSYQVYEIFEHLARLMHAKLFTFNEAMSTYLKSVKEQDKAIRSICSDWKAFRDEYVTELRYKERIIRDNMKKARNEITRMKSSVVLKAPPSNIYNAAKMKSSWMTWLGLQCTRCSVTHKGAYEEVEVRGLFGGYDLYEDKTRSTVTVVVRSKIYGDVDAKVMFMKAERDLDETKERIREKEAQIVVFQNEIQRMDENLRNLATASSSEDLTNLVVTKKMEREIDDITAASNSVAEKVPTGIYDDDKVEVEVEFRAACEGLHKLINALKKKDAIPEVISQTGWLASMNKFITTFNEYKKVVAKYEQNVCAGRLERMMDQRVVASPSRKPANIDVHEGETKIAKWYLSIVEMLLLLWALLYPKVGAVVRDHPIPTLVSFGVALLCVSFKLRPTASLGVFMIVLGVLLAVSQTSYALRRLLLKEVQDFKCEMERRLDGLEEAVSDGGTEVKRQVDEARKALLEMLQRRCENADARLTMNMLLMIPVKAALAACCGGAKLE